jgi:predicted sulfurtransferase
MVVQHMAKRLRALWEPFGALGRIYVAEEGMNAQMAVPSNVVTHFEAACRSAPFPHINPPSHTCPPFLQSHTHPLTLPPLLLRSLPELEKVFLNLDRQQPMADYLADPGFDALHIRVRNQVVADGGLEKAYDWQDCGKPMVSREQGDWARGKGCGGGDKGNQSG